MGRPDIGSLPMMQVLVFIPFDFIGYISRFEYQFGLWKQSGAFGALTENQVFAKPVFSGGLSCWLPLVVTDGSPF
jgi:hypothetical protein